MARSRIDVALNSGELERSQSLLRETIDAAEEARNVNKKRGGFTGNVVRFVKRNAQKLGVNSFGLLGERGLKISGIVGATAGLLAVDKAVAAARDVFQGASIKDAIATQIKEVIPPLLRQTLPALLDELNRRQRLEEESARGADVFDRDLENRLKNSPEIKRRAQRKWLDFWESPEGFEQRDKDLNKERRAKEADGVSY